MGGISQGQSMFERYGHEAMIFDFRESFSASHSRSSSTSQTCVCAQETLSSMKARRYTLQVRALDAVAGYISSTPRFEREIVIV